MGVHDVFAENGVLAQALTAYRLQPSQVDMANEVDVALSEAGTLVCEAGTGTGKSFAYLVPALLSGHKVIVSTGTKHLQDQLFQRDVPFLAKTLGLAVKTAILKGRANYLCLHRLDQYIADGRFDSPQVAADLTTISAWRGRTKTGDISECTDVAEDARAWRYATSTADNCLGTKCPVYAECHVNLARREAFAADLVIVNHHLFFADLTLKQEGFAELLPNADAVVFDEAHQLPDVATRFFGISVSSGQLMELARDTRVAYQADLGDTPGLLDRIADLEGAVGALRRRFGSGPSRVAWAEMAKRPGVRDAVVDLGETLRALDDGLSELEGRAESVDAILKRTSYMVERLQALIQPQQDAQVLPWVDLGPRNFVWHLSPLDVAHPFTEHTTAPHRARIFTSATLAVGEELSHFVSRLGLEDSRQRIWASPFNFREQTLCYLPKRLPEPRNPDFAAAFLEATTEVLKASKGRAFVLFTSHGSLRAAASALPERVSYPLFVQGSQPRSALLADFVRTDNAVLLGTYSFWEGVDVPGPALSCVIIDKLPFAPPDDPLLQARLHLLKTQGLEPFFHYQLPQAVLALKQGVGRLVRGAEDRGVVMLADTRLVTKGYGKVFMSSLPDMARTRELDDVRSFFCDD